MTTDTRDKRALGQGRGFHVFTLVREVVTPCEWGNRANRTVFDVLGIRDYSSLHPEGPMSRKVELIWEIQFDYSCLMTVLRGNNLGLYLNTVMCSVA